jgi:DHA1 family bicyclomycin/chloramphenicol resistance-like MFS transporter/DHA1 family 2-module integral membrane pump EmrD-like MFS transporter
MHSKKLLFFIVVLAACLTMVASDIYAPSLPSIAFDLNTSVDEVQWSMAIYMLGVAISQLIYGPISEGVGRKWPMAAGLAIMLFGSLVCIWAVNIDMLIWGRFIQGIGAGAAATLWRSIFRDVYSGEELAQKGSYLVIFIMFLVPAAPALGGYLQEYFGWRSSFVFMCAYTAITLLSVVFGFQETSQHHHLERLRLPYIGKTFLHLLTSRIFMGITLCTFLSYGALFAWFVVGPVLLIKNLGLTPVEFGWISFLGGGAAYASAGVLNGKCVKRVGIPNMMRFGWSVMILAGVLMAVLTFLVGTTVWTVVAPALLFYFGSTFLWPNAVATAFTPFGKIAGYTGCLYGFMQICGASFMGGVMSYLPDENQLPLAAVIIFSSIASWLIYEVAIPKNPSFK